MQKEFMYSWIFVLHKISVAMNVHIVFRGEHLYFRDLLCSSMFHKVSTRIGCAACIDCIAPCETITASKVPY